MSEEGCEDVILNTISKMMNFISDEKTVYTVLDKKYSEKIKITDFTGVGLFLSMLWSPELYTEYRINGMVITNIANNQRMNVTDFANSVCKKRMKKNLMIVIEIRLTNPNYDSSLPPTHQQSYNRYHPLLAETMGTINDEEYIVNFTSVNPSEFIYFKKMITLGRYYWTITNSTDDFNRTTVHIKNFLVLNPNSGNYYPLKSSKGTKYILEGTKILRREDEQGFRDWDNLLKNVPYNKTTSSCMSDTLAFLNFIGGTYLSPRNPEWGIENKVTINKNAIVFSTSTGKLVMSKDHNLGSFLKNLRGIGVIFVIWDFNSSSHSTVLIYNSEDNTVYHMDPVGRGDKMIEILVYKIFGREKHKLKSLYDYFKYGPQKKQSTAPFPSYIGSCGTWTRYFISMLMINPDKSIQGMMDYIMAKSPSQMSSTIRKFEEFTYRAMGNSLTTNSTEQEVDQKEWNRKMDARKKSKE